MDDSLTTLVRVCVHACVCVLEPCSVYLTWSMACMEKLKLMNSHIGRRPACQHNYI